MAFAQDIRNIEAGIAHRISKAYHNTAMRMAERRLERRTYKELMALSDRELEDLGLHRAMIASIAHDAAKRH